MTARRSHLARVCACAVLTAVGVSRHLYRDVLAASPRSGRRDAEERVPPAREAGASFPAAAATYDGASKAESAYNDTYLTSPTEKTEWTYNDTHHAATSPAKKADNDTFHNATFPIKTHILTHGKARTATTLLFNMVGVSYFLHLLHRDPARIPELEFLYLKRSGIKVPGDRGREVPLRKFNTTKVCKVHNAMDMYRNSHGVVFSTAETKEEAAEIRKNLTEDGHAVAFVQDMDSVKEVGVPGLVDDYVAGYGLSERDRANLNEYFRHWAVLRQCCGQQMSGRWRNDLFPDKFKLEKFSSHPTCHTYDIDAVERAFMRTELFQMIERYPNVRALNKPSLNDGALNGTYCSSYNHRVRTQGLSIWGRPGGRSARSHVDRAIKDQIQIGRHDLTEAGRALFPDESLSIQAQFKKIWRRPKEEKTQWLKAVLAARPDGNDTLPDYYIAALNDNGAKDGDAGNLVGAGATHDTVKRRSSDAGIEKKTADATAKTPVAAVDGTTPSRRNKDRGGDRATVAAIGESPSGRDATTKTSVAAIDGKKPSRRGSKNKNSTAEIKTKDGGEEQASVAVIDGKKTSGSGFENTHAIFLISFGEEAAESTLVERCVLSLRRRGTWGGYIVVLTDAPPERYANEWDERVLVVHPLEEHMMSADGRPMTYSRANRSLKCKRFKTYILDYCDREKRLDSVEFVYYLDIDILAGNSIENLFDGIQRKYISSKEQGRELSKLHFFTPLSEEWPLQGGTFVVDRRSSGHCLDLWRAEMDQLVLSGRGRDQDALRTVYQRIEAGEESQCRLIRMDNEHFVTFPTSRQWDADLYHDYNLIHISNSVFAKRIDEEKQNELIHELLQLSEEEKPKYGKVSIKA